MIVIVGNGAELSPAEKVVHRLLTSWQTGNVRVGGVAVLSCNVRRRSGVSSHELDALVWTPFGCTVVEIKGFRTVQHGTVDPRLNGAWRVGDAVADLYGLKSADNPVAQAKPYMYAVKNRLQRADLPDWVELLVVLVHQERAHLRIASPQLEDGVFLAAACPRRDRALREHFTAPPGSPRRWSGEHIQQAFHALELDDYLPARVDLAAEGFHFFDLSETTTTGVEVDEGGDPFGPLPAPTPQRIPSTSLWSPRPPHHPAPAVPASPHSDTAEPEPSSMPPRRAEDPEEDRWAARRPEDAPGPPATEQRTGHDQAYDLEHPRRHRPPISDRYPLYPPSPPPFPVPAERRWPQWLDIESLISALLILPLAILLLVAMVRCGAEDTPTHTGDPVTTSTRQLPPPPAPQPAVSAPPAHTPNSCMPFQANC